jgi:predicted TPR repeat methyltransferase
LVYFGALEAALGAAGRALRPGGHLAFTVEALEDGDDGPGFHLNPHGRYSHTPEYLRRTLTGAGFVAIAIDPVHLRLERSLPVAGFLVTARRKNPLSPARGRGQG